MPQLSYLLLFIMQLRRSTRGNSKHELETFLLALILKQNIQLISGNINDN